MTFSLYSSDEHERPSRGRLVGKTVAWALLFALTIVIGMAGIVPQLLGAATQPMRSAALEPDISQGDLIVSEPVDPQSLEAGDIITFRPAGGTPSLTRKVVAVEPVEEVVADAGSPATGGSGMNSVAAIVTSGDATTKEYRISGGQVIGKVAYHLPFAGILSREALGANPLLIVFVLVLTVAVIVVLRERRTSRAE
ncbi:hypothetical protein ACLRGF_01870 [Mycetocola zhadangensis]|uniref:hypothetical protein n=1 Tax=Mycetocola zhadangensis TaxID=1164595 RepID=UPI003A4D80A8